MPDVTPLAAAERRDLADYLDTLTPEDWHRPTLCPAWSVHDVAAHITSYDLLTWPALLALFARSGFSLTRANHARMKESRPLRPEALTARLRTHATPRGITAMFGGAIALTDTLIHHQDIRRALNHPRQISPERLLAALEFAPRARALPAPANLRGIRATATDLDWTHGTGPELRGPAESLLVALAGRPQALADLKGPGLAALEARLRR